jgi:hypothetical protein
MEVTGETVVLGTVYGLKLSSVVILISNINIQLLTSRNLQICFCHVFRWFNCLTGLLGLWDMETKGERKMKIPTATIPS